MGSNQGRPRENLRAALAAMAGLPGYEHRAVSSCYRTAPVGPVEQPPFVNAVARGSYAGSARELLAALLAIERQRGRQRVVRWGPRTLDLDLLLYGRQIIREPDLKVPHPEMAGRAFVLVPMAELAPDLKLPGLGRSARQLLAAMDPAEKERQSVEKISSCWD